MMVIISSTSIGSELSDGMWNKYKLNRVVIPLLLFLLAIIQEDKNENLEEQ